MSRRLALVWLSVVVSGCAYGDIADPPEPDQTLTTEAIAVEDSLDEIDTVFHGVDSEDLVMAWSDLDADLRSVVNDLMRDPRSVDMVGLRARVEGFIARFGSEAEMAEVNGQWEDLLDRLDNLAARTVSS